MKKTTQRQYYEAPDGFVYTDGNGFYSALDLGAYDSIDNYKLITIEEFNRIMDERKKALEDA